MQLTVCAGKGGVGKSTSATALAVYLAGTGRKTAIIDLDAGHSVKGVLGHKSVPGLEVIIIDPKPFTPIEKAKVGGGKWSFGTYMLQFPGDLGIIALNDMIQAFFGLTPDIETLSKFAMLTEHLHRLEAADYDYVVIDVEPTAGLQRLFNHAESTIRSLHTLQKQGIISLSFLKAKWPDIAAYLQSEFIRNAHYYASRIEHSVELMRQANYLLVCIPEFGPVEQLMEVRDIIADFGGETMGYVVNNIRGDASEARHIERIKRLQRPTKFVKRRPELHAEKSGHEERLKVLVEMGSIIVEIFEPIPALD